MAPARSHCGLKQKNLCTNDPLWLECFEGIGENSWTILDYCRPISNFYSDASGLTALIEQEYTHIACSDWTFSRQVPRSAFAYYHNILYWYKLSIHSLKRGDATWEEQQLINFIDGHTSLKSASGVATYLSGLGDFEDQTGVKHYLKSPRAMVNGHWGRITAETHNLYESSPSTAFSLQRVLEDMRRTENRAVNDPIWDIPTLRPDEPAPSAPQAAQPCPAQCQASPDLETEETDPEVVPPPQPQCVVAPLEAGIRPTANLLGWRPSVMLTTEQFFAMESIFDEVRDHNQVNLINSQFAINRSLFEFVAHNMDTLSCYKVLQLPTSTCGSVAQQVVWSPEVTREQNFQRTIQLNQIDGAIRSRTTLPLVLATAAKVMAYRTIKRDFNYKDEAGQFVYSPWCCYDFNNYRDVPQKWRDNRNDVVAAGLDHLIDYTPFAGPIEPRDTTVSNFLTKLKIAKV